MTTRTLAPVLPIEVRRQLWARLWRDCLLRPHADHSSVNIGQPHPAGQEEPADSVCPSDPPGRVAG